MPGEGHTKMGTEEARHVLVGPLVHLVERWEEDLLAAGCAMRALAGVAATSTGALRCAQEGLPGPAVGLLSCGRLDASHQAVVVEALASMAHSVEGAKACASHGAVPALIQALDAVSELEHEHGRGPFAYTGLALKARKAKPKPGAAGASRNPPDRRRDGPAQRTPEGALADAAIRALADLAANAEGRQV